MKALIVLVGLVGLLASVGCIVEEEHHYRGGYYGGFYGEYPDHYYGRHYYNHPYDHRYYWDR